MTTALIDLRAIPCPLKGADVMSMPLSSMEGYLFSRLDGVMNIEELCAAVGLSHEELSTIIGKLSELGAVEVKEAPEEPKARPRAEGKKSRAADDDDEENEGDLSLDMRRDIMGMRLHIDQANFYQMLGVPPKADRATLRKAYFDLSRKYHPDSYYGKDLGRYRSMMEFIFAKLSEAYETLSRKKRREAYDEYIADQIAAYEMERRLAGDSESASTVQDESEGYQLVPHQFTTVPVAEIKGSPGAEGRAGPIAAPRGRPAALPPEEQPKDAAVKTKFQPKFSAEVIKMAEALVPRETVEPSTPGEDKVKFPKGPPPRPPPQRPAAPTAPKAASAPSAPPARQAPPQSAPAATPPPQAPPSQPVAKLAPESEAIRKLRAKRGKSALQSLLRKGQPMAAPRRPQTQQPEDNPLTQYGIELKLERPLPGASPEELLSYQFTGAAIDALKIKDIPKAVSLLERVTELDPENRQAEKALETLRTEATGALVSSYVRQGNYEEHTGKHRQAADSFLKALTYKPGDHNLMIKAATNLLRGDGDLKKARGLARRAIGLKPKDAEYRAALAEIYLRLGMEPEALEELEVAHRLDPGNEKVNRMLRGIEGQK